MFVLGVDPGYGIMGYGIISKSGNVLNYVDHGVLQTEKRVPLKKRLKEIYEAFLEILEKYRPDVVGVEKIYFVKNVTTALDVAQVRGVVLLACEQHGLEVVEVSPQEVKISVTGYGRATKRQVQYMISKLLNLEDIPKPDDAADALAIAWCVANSGRLNNDTGI